MPVPSDMSVDMTVDLMRTISNVKTTFLCNKTFHKLNQQSTIEKMKSECPLYTNLSIVDELISL